MSRLNKKKIRWVSKLIIASTLGLTAGAIFLATNNNSALQSSNIITTNLAVQEQSTGADARENFIIDNKNIVTGLSPQGKALSTLQIPADIIGIGDNAFANDQALTTITIPSSVNSIGANIFQGCDKLTSVTSNSPVLFDWWVSHHQYEVGQEKKPTTLSQMTDIDLSQQQYLNSENKPFTTIASYAFANDTKLKKITFSLDITSIDKNAFANLNDQVQYIVYSTGTKTLLLNSDSNIKANQIIFQTQSSLVALAVGSSIMAVMLIAVLFFIFKKIYRCKTKSS